MYCLMSARSTNARSMACAPSAALGCRPHALQRPPPDAPLPRPAGQPSDHAPPRTRSGGPGTADVTVQQAAVLSLGACSDSLAPFKLSVNLFWLCDQVAYLSRRRSSL
jgi:hypothetical protein